MATLLVLLLIVPAVGVIGLYSVPAAQAARIGAGTGAVVFLLSVLLLPLFDYAHPGQMQAQVNHSWVPAFDLRFHLGVDGISLPLLLLTTLLTALCLLYSARTTPADESGRAYTALLLLLEIGMVGTFVAQDLLLFFIFFEIVLIPMYALILRWGSGQRRDAANKFILYTLLGSALMLVGFLLIHAKTGTFDMVALTREHGSGMTASAQAAAFLLVGLGFAIKTPMWPLHTWLPDAHTCAPTAGSVLLAGVLLKMGTYGFIRIGVGIVPDGAHRYAMALATFGTIGIVYGALVCMAQVRRGGDLKRLIAYSSVGHMGFVLLGIATLTRIGLDGALFASVAHGLITGLLFFIAGGFKERTGTTDLYALGRGLYDRARRLGVLIAFTAMASLGLPGLAGFWGEAFAVVGAVNPANGLPSAGFHTLLVFAGLGVILTAAYFLMVVRRVCMGVPGDAVPGLHYPEIPDLTPRELVSWTPLAGLTLVAGLWPAVILALSDPAVHRLIGGAR
jgi:NADH-quinone oxidoreductase subunit M